MKEELTRHVLFEKYLCLTVAIPYCTGDFIVKNFKSENGFKKALHNWVSREEAKSISFYVFSDSIVGIYSDFYLIISENYESKHSRVVLVGRIVPKSRCIIL
jgi:hypothetical protein